MVPAFNQFHQGASSCGRMGGLVSHLGEFVWEIVGGDFAATAQLCEVFHHVGHFPDISRPTIAFQQLSRVGSERITNLVLAAGFCKKMIQQQTHVRNQAAIPISGPAIPKGWHANLNDTQSVEKVFAELTLFHHLSKVLIGGGDDANVHLGGLVTTDFPDLLLLQNPQQTHLETGRCLTDFIKENGSTVGLFE